MRALVRYQLALLLRSHRWIPPAVLFVLGVAGLGDVRQPLGGGLASGLSWSALMLVPVVAWLTRSMLTAEPKEARACVAAAGGPGRAQSAALIAALVVGAVFGLAGVVWELFSAGVMRAPGTHAIEVAATFRVVGGGLLAGVICLFVASAIGALFNPPVIRRPGAAMLITTAAVVASLAWDVSPANAALRSPGTGVRGSSWPPGVPLAASVVLLAVAWSVSVFFAARRDG